MSLLGPEPAWQDIDDRCHLCHWWQYILSRIITAMTLFLAFALILTLAVLAAVVVEVVRVVRGDGYGHRPTPRSLADDTDTRIETLARLAR
jgi:hypothetical protein